MSTATVTLTPCEVKFDPYIRVSPTDTSVQRLFRARARFPNSGWKSSLYLRMRQLNFTDTFWSCSQASGARRSSFSNPPQPLLNAVRSKQENFTSAFPVTWAQKVALSTPTIPTKSPQKSPSRLVPSAGASPVRSPTSSSPWSASTSSQSYRGNSVLFLLERFSFECRIVIGFALTTPPDWFKNLAPFFHPITSKTKTNLDSRAHVFPRFASATCNYFEF